MQGCICKDACTMMQANGCKCKNASERMRVQELLHHGENGIDTSRIKQ